MNEIPLKVDFANKTIGQFPFEFVRGISTQSVGAAEFGEAMETMERIEENNFESWIEEWSSTADRVASYAESGLQIADKITARGAFLRASNYYRMAVFYAKHTDPRHTKLWKLSRECFLKMIPLSEFPIEYLEIDFEGNRLPAYFISAGEGKHPTLIALGGFDSTMEEVYCWIGEAAVKNGWHCLVFEGPGQWGALKANQGLVFRPDYEKPVTAVIDYLYTRQDVDRDRIALIGYSAGGYYAPRAAAEDLRIKACIPNSLVVDCGEAARVALKGMGDPKQIDSVFDMMMEKRIDLRWGFQHSQWTLGIKKPHEWFEAYRDFTLSGLEKKFKNPMLFLFGEDDILNMAASSPTIATGTLDFIASLDCPRAVHLFSRKEGASSHCQMGGLSYAHSIVFQWLNETLCGKEPRKSSDSLTRQAFIEVFKKNAGEAGGEKAERLLDEIQLI